MGGRGSREPLQFSVPDENSKGEAYNAIIEKPHEQVKDALGKRGKEMGYVKAAEGANPYYSDRYDAYSENCQRCVVAYELRRRGYDVIAQPTYQGDKWKTSKEINGIPQDRWRGAFRHAKTELVGDQKMSKTLDNIENKMKEYGSGSRAVISIEYKGRGGRGHVFNVENVNGRIVYIDAQDKTWGNSHRYTRADMMNMMDIVKTRKTTITRTDNLRISDRAKHFVTPRKKG